MAEADPIRFIVGTYELNPELEEKITNIATNRLSEQQISSFQDRYTYVAELVDKFTRPYKDRFARSLDQRISHDDERTMHEVVGKEDKGLKRLIQGKNQIKTLHAYEVIELLQSQLASRYLDFLGELLFSHAEVYLWNFSSERLLKNVSHIKSAMTQLDQQYGRNGRIVLPPRPIRSIRNGSQGLEIEFGKRRYQGSPLEFFEQNRVIYEGMGRTQLARFDQGLYMSLRSANQLHLAIPDTKYSPSHRRLPQSEVDKIIEHFESNRGNLDETSSQVGYCKETVRRYLKKNGIAIPGPQGKD